MESFILWFCTLFIGNLLSSFWSTTCWIWFCGSETFIPKCQAGIFLYIVTILSSSISFSYWNNYKRYSLSFIQDFLFQAKYGNADGITDAIKESFNDIKESTSSSLTSVGILPYHKKLVGFTSDGASVNRGCNDSIKTRLREKSPWMVFIWCVAHRLELALSDALTL